MKRTMSLEDLSEDNLSVWSEMRQDLWDDCDAERNASDYRRYRQEAEKGNALTMLALCSGEAVGFVEAELRRDFVPGAINRPIWYIEGIYIKRRYRRGGAGSDLVRGLAKRVNATEVASDTEPENRSSRSFHKAIGFKEVERSVHFWMDLSKRGD